MVSSSVSCLASREEHAPDQISHLTAFYGEWVAWIFHDTVYLHEPVAVGQFSALQRGVLYSRTQWRILVLVIWVGRVVDEWGGDGTVGVRG